MPPCSNKSLSTYCLDQSNPWLKYFNSESKVGSDLEHVPCFNHSCFHSSPSCFLVHVFDSFISVQRFFNSGIMVFKAFKLNVVWLLQKAGPKAPILDGLKLYEKKFRKTDSIFNYIDVSYKYQIPCIVHWLRLAGKLQVWVFELTVQVWQKVYGHDWENTNISHSLLYRAIKNT